MFIHKYKTIMLCFIRHTVEIGLTLVYVADLFSKELDFSTELGQKIYVCHKKFDDQFYNK